ncbi:uncharacterized protein [Miscanthus floridulus]|uniref:uncharacterized protein n=1 Tax=Miscanthus floridulus TaxID=154761 RepID=UPI00345A3C29
MSNIFARLLRDIPAQGAMTTILPAVECSIDTVLPAVECSIDAVDQALQQLQLQPTGATAPAPPTINMQQTPEPTSPTVNLQAANFQALFAGVAAFFTNTTPPIILSKPSPLKAPPAVQRRRRQRRVFDMSSEFVAMFNGPLPEQVIAALAEMFNLDDGPAMEINETLIDLAGEGIADLQEAILPTAT